MIKAAPHKSSLGDLDGNVMAMLVYIVTYLMMRIPGLGGFAWIVPLLIYLTEKGSPFVKFHALQVLVLSIAQLIVSFLATFVLGALVLIFAASMLNPLGLAGLIFIPFLNLVISVTFTIFAGMACIKAQQYFEYEIPLIGRWTRTFGKFY